MRWEVWQEPYWMNQKEVRGAYTESMFDSARARNGKLRRRASIRKKIQVWEKEVASASPPFRQALHLIDKFGGILPFSIAAGIHPDLIIKNWLGVDVKGRVRVNPKRDRFYGTDGIIPMRYLTRLLKIARYWGVMLRPHDIFPDLLTEEGIKNYANDKDIQNWIMQIKADKKFQRLEDVVASLVSTRV